MKIFIRSIAFLSLIAIVSGCNKNTIILHITTRHNADTVSAISPASAMIYSAVTISGSGFDTVKTNNVVKFNGVTSIVNSATPTQIVATVPASATTGKVTITTNGKTITIPNIFKVLQLVNNGSYTIPGDGSYTAIAFDKNENMYVADAGGSISKYANGVLVKTYTLLPYTGPVNPTGGNQGPGIDGGSYQTITFGLTLDKQGNLYAGQNYTYTHGTIFAGFTTGVVQSQVVKITPVGNVSVFAGDLTNNTRQFFFISDLVADTSGNIYVADLMDAKIKKISPAGDVTTFAGSGTPGTSDGSAASAQFAGLLSLALDNNGNVYAGDFNSIRKITPQGTVSTLYNANPAQIFNRNTFYDILLGNSPYIHSATSIGSIEKIVFDASNNLFFINDNTNNPYTVSIFMINQAGAINNFITTGYYNTGMAIDNTGSFYILILNGGVVKYSVQ